MGLLLLVVAANTRSMRSSLLLCIHSTTCTPHCVVVVVVGADAFVVRPETSWSRPQIRESPTAQYSNFFKDVFGSAFANDPSLSQDDKLEGMLDEAALGDDHEAERQLRVQQLTSTQQQWRQKMMSLTSGAVATTDLEGSLYSIDLFLTGVPNKDPSNDLFGSQTNISSRDRVVGLTLPREPSVTDVQLLLEPNGVCRVVKDASGFCLTLSTSAAASSASAAKGDWKLSDDGRQIRFRVPVTGYKRTIETKGTIQKVYWSKDEEKSTQTSTVYTIPKGYLYFETAISSKRQQPSQPRADSNSVAALVQWSDDDAVLKVERSMGLLGAASRMIPCGKFRAKLVRSNSSDNADDDKNSNTPAPTPPTNQQQPQESSS